MIKKFLVLILLSTTLSAQGSLPNQLRVVTDANGYLVVTGGAQTLPLNQPTTFTNTRLQTDANGYLVVTIASGTINGPIIIDTGTAAVVPLSLNGNVNDVFHSFFANNINTGNAAYTDFRLQVGNTVSYVGSSSQNIVDTNAAGKSRSWLDTASGIAGSGWDYSAPNASGNHRFYTAGYAAANLRATIDSTGIALANSGTYQAAQKILLKSTGTTATQIASTQTTPPTCSSNCGTSVPTQVGTDSDMIITMGSGGTPTSGFVVTFNGTWAAAPSCTGSMAKAGMAVGKLPMVIVPTTTTITVTTNGVNPSVNDVYSFHCFGVQ